MCDWFISFHSRSREAPHLLSNLDVNDMLYIKRVSCHARNLVTERTKLSTTSGHLDIGVERLSSSCIVVRKGEELVHTVVFVSQISKVNVMTKMNDHFLVCILSFLMRVSCWMYSRFVC